MGYYAWRAWRLAGGLPSQRPKGLRDKVPARWWMRLALYRLRHPVVSAPPLGSIGRGLSALFNSPVGGIEDVEGMRRAGGLTTMFLNIRELGWSTIRSRAFLQGVTIIPWQRCFTKADVVWLREVAQSWASPAVGINYEPSDADTTLTPDEILDAIKDYTGTTYLIVSPWMENDVQWGKLARRCVFVIEGFTNERNPTTGKPWPIPDLVEHAHKLGALSVAVMAGVYPAAFSPPQNLAEWRQHWAGAPIVYLGDNLGADMKRWSAWNPSTPQEV